MSVCPTLTPLASLKRITIVGPYSCRRPNTRYVATAAAASGTTQTAEIGHLRFLTVAAGNPAASCRPLLSCGVGDGVLMSLRIVPDQARIETACCQDGQHHHGSEGQQAGPRQDRCQLPQ